MQLNFFSKLLSFLYFLTSLHLFANESKSNTEKVGDLFLILLPSTTFVTTYVKDDAIGRDQFYKSFTANAGATYFLKYTIHEERPDKSDDDSFPSGHTSFTFQSAVFLHKRYGLNYAIPAYFAATFTGWSRIDSNKHYTHDVLAGAALGIASGFYFTTSYNNLTISPIVENKKYNLQIKYIW